MIRSKVSIRLYVIKRLFYMVLRKVPLGKPVECGLGFLIIFFVIYSLRWPTKWHTGFVPLTDIYTDIETCSLDIKSRGSDVPIIICPLIPRGLKASTKVSKSINETFLDQLPRRTNIRKGGRWSPHHCRPQHRVAIVVPYRNRPDQLKIFLQHMHPFLQTQLLDYGIYIVEQSQLHQFNRAKLFNIGFQEALKIHDYCCFIFHDIDLLPESPRHMYTCSKQPRHLCSSIDTFRYVLPYPDLFGGVVAVQRRQFEAINGFSNDFFGWGGEDDDFAARIKNAELTIVRWDPQVSRYTMLHHNKADPNPERFQLLKSGPERFEMDGLNSLMYRVLSTDYEPLFTRILVDVKPDE